MSAERTESVEMAVSVRPNKGRTGKVQRSGGSGKLAQRFSHHSTSPHQARSQSSQPAAQKLSPVQQRCTTRILLSNAANDTGVGGRDKPIDTYSNYDLDYEGYASPSGTCSAYNTRDDFQATRQSRSTSIRRITQIETLDDVEPIKSTEDSRGKKSSDKKFVEILIKTGEDKSSESLTNDIEETIYDDGRYRKKYQKKSEPSNDRSQSRRGDSKDSKKSSKPKSTKSGHRKPRKPESTTKRTEHSDDNEEGVLYTTVTIKAMSSEEKLNSTHETECNEIKEKKSKRDSVKAADGKLGEKPKVAEKSRRSAPNGVETGSTEGDDGSKTAVLKRSRKKSTGSADIKKPSDSHSSSKPQQETELVASALQSLVDLLVSKTKKPVESPAITYPSEPMIVVVMPQKTTSTINITDKPPKPSSKAASSSSSES